MLLIYAIGDVLTTFYEFLESVFIRIICLFSGLESVFDKIEFPIIVSELLETGSFG